MEEKLGRVTSWLQKIYENVPIPAYEVNARTVDILYEMVQLFEERDRDLSLLIEDTKQKAAEYEAEANFLEGVLTESLGLSINHLSKEGIEHLNVLVDSAMALETKDTSLTSFFCAINDMTSELYATESKNKEIALELNKIHEKLTAALLLEKRFKKDLKETQVLLEADTAKIDTQSQKLKFLQDKSQDLKRRIKAAEEQLIAMGLDQSLTHESLGNLSEKLGEMQKEVVLLEAELESYLDLPPSLTLAKVKIEEVKRELNALEEEMVKEIDVLTLHL